LSLISFGLINVIKRLNNVKRQFSNGYVTAKNLSQLWRIVRFQIAYFEICKSSTRYPAVDLDFMSLLSEIVDKLSVTNMSVWHGISGSVCYELIYDDTSSTNIIGTLSVIQTMFVRVKYEVYDSTTTKHWRNEHVTDLGDSKFSAFKQVRQQN